MGEGKFLYAIIERPKTDDFPDTGLNDAALAVVGYGDLAAVISTIDVDQLTAGDAAWLKAALVRYQQVNAALWQHHTLVPLRFGVTARNEEQVQEVLSKVYLHLRALLARLRGKAELVVQALWDLPKLVQEMRQQMGEAEDRMAAVEVGGKLFEAAEVRRTTYVTAIDTQLSPLAEDFADAPCQGDMMILNRSYLVDRDRQPLFDDTMQRLGEHYANHVTFRYIGPLAPSSFANVKLTQGNFALVDQARRTLQLGETATLEQIKVAYRRQLYAHHPDRNPGDPRADERCKTAIAAYDTLSAYCISCQHPAIDGVPTTYRFSPEAVERVFIIQQG